MKIKTLCIILLSIQFLIALLFSWRLNHAWYIILLDVIIIITIILLIKIIREEEEKK